MIHRPHDNADLAAIVASPGDTVMLRPPKDYVYSSAALPTTLFYPNYVTLGMRGTGEKPVISAGVVHTSWTYDPVNDVWASPPFADNFLGNVTEDGVPMKFIPWTKDPAQEYDGVNFTPTTHGPHLTYSASRMTAGHRRPAWSGSMTMNPYTKVLYIRPSAGVPSEHVYVVSAAGSNNNCGLFAGGATPSRGMRMVDVLIKSASRHAIYLLNKIDPRLERVEMQFIGGAKPNPAPYSQGGLYMGNGLEMSNGVFGAEVIECSARDIFETGFTSQLYSGSPMEIGWHHYENCVVERFGMHGIEVSAHKPNQRITDVYADGLTTTDGGATASTHYCWSGNRDGSSFAIFVDPLYVNQSLITRAFASNVKATNMPRLYMGLRHGGICGIEDSTTVGTHGSHNQDITRDPGATVGSVDFRRNVPVGRTVSGSFTATQARLVRGRAPAIL